MVVQNGLVLNLPQVCPKWSGPCCTCAYLQNNYPIDETYSNILSITRADSAQTIAYSDILIVSKESHEKVMRNP